MTLQSQINPDGKFLPRLFPALMAGAVTLVLGLSSVSLFFWRDSAVIDAKTQNDMESLKARQLELSLRYDRELGEIRREQLDLRREAATDRTTTAAAVAAVAADVRVLVNTTTRTEKAVETLQNDIRSLPPVPPSRR